MPAHSPCCICNACGWRSGKREPAPAPGQPAVRFLKHGSRAHPKVSLILLDWSVRESFHLLHYLSRQDVDRDAFEVIVIEYYSRESGAIREFAHQVDTWLLLEMPESCYYHKHLMYNAGIVAANGEICVICDSDAMVKPGFIRTIISEYEQNPDIVLHLDQFRNSRRDLYPFGYPEFEEVTGKGCINNVNGQTRGIVSDEDPIHERNYGACMCARRADLIAIGGADEHIDYLGHICGPYDMTFRLANFGRRDIWHQTEFMYHTWHPGEAGEDNYLGPHDGRHISTTAFDALACGRILPLVENPAIRRLRLADGAGAAPGPFEISPAHRNAWNKESLRRGQEWVNSSTTRKVWNGYVLERTADGFVAYPRLVEQPGFGQYRGEFEIRGATEEGVRAQVAGSLPVSMKMTFPILQALTYVSRAAGLVYLKLRQRLGRLVMAAAA